MLVEEAGVQTLHCHNTKHWPHGQKNIGNYSLWLNEEKPTRFLCSAFLLPLLIKHFHLALFNFSMICHKLLVKKPLDCKLLGAGCNISLLILLAVIQHYMMNSYVLKNTCVSCWGLCIHIQTESSSMKWINQVS